MKKIIIPVIIIIILAGISCILFIPKKSNLDSTDKDTVVKENTNIVESKNIEVESEVDNEEIEESVIEDNNQNIKEETKTEVKNDSNSVQEEQKKEESTLNNNKTAWEELGISEYDYYHKPMWDWARIDFSIEVYKTYEKTREACITKGEEYFEQGLGYSCSSINSYSGDYLGEMIKTF